VALTKEQTQHLTCTILIVILIAATYSNVLRAPFIYDDRTNIVENISIRSLWPPWSPLHISSDAGITGRPFINFTFAINYAISGDNVWSYHALNIFIHILAALTLWGIIRRTLTNVNLMDRYGPSVPAWIALGYTLLWALHPLQTQAVTYLSQRCESLMGLFFLLVFYCAVRGWHSVEHKRIWHLLAILSFIFGAGCKEVIAAAPILLVFYDWVFTKRSWKEILKASPLLYTGLALGLAGEFLLLAAGGTTSAGTGDHSFTLTEYWLLQPPVLLHYIRLVFWPSDLTLDYGMDFHGMIETWPAFFSIVTLIIVALWLLFKRQPSGFFLAWFLTILAPTSLYPLPDAAYEHRMYLPSIAVIILTLGGLYKLGLRSSERVILDANERSVWLGKAGRYVMVLLVLAATITTYTRNLYYQTEVSIWADNVAKRPQSGRAQSNLGNALLGAGKPIDAIQHLRRALDLMESQPVILNPRNLANTLSCMGAAHLTLGQKKIAEYYFRKALQIQPNHAHAETNLGRTLFLLNRNDEAILHFQRAILLNPNYVEAYSNYGVFLRVKGNLKEAEAQFLTALQLQPKHIEANIGMGLVMYLQRQYREARSYFQKVLAVKADNEFARNMLIELDKRERQ